MSITLDLPPDAQARLAAEASRRGVSVDAIVTELAGQLPISAESALSPMSFVGIGHSGRGDLARRHREIRAEQTAGPTACGL